ncbi:MAG: hypothetical protein OEW77_07390 [Gemmatimonadota bacterium]|nr:hypothetical protein [Gemmatimonadota bacterium]
MNLSRYSFFAGAAAVLLLLCATTLFAQSTGRVRVALVEALSSPDARAEILRFSEPGQRDIILLPASSANPLDLAAALELYRRQAGRTTAKPGLVGRTTLTVQRGAEHLRPESVRRAVQMLRAVQGSGEVRIGNLGRGRWEEFDVTP